MHSRWVRFLARLAVAACGVGACAGHPSNSAATPQPSPPSTPAAVSAPATLLPDGVVPFVDEPAAPIEFDGRLPTPPPPPAPSGPPCAASQLTGTLPTWISKSRNSGGEKMDPTMAASLYGWVVLTNASATPCTLQGKVDVQLTDTAGPLRMDYSNNINSAAQARVTGVPANANASLRLDWSAPFCVPITGRLVAHLTLPNGGGVLDAPVTDPQVPGCVHQENQPQLSGGVFVSAFEPGNAATVQTLPTSPLAVLKTSIVSHPTEGAPGQSIRYVVGLTNPTSYPVALTGPVGFNQFIGSRGGSGVQPFQYSITYRLNRRVITAIAAHATVRYEVLLTVPSTMVRQLTMDIHWLLITAWLIPEVSEDNGFTISIT